MRTVSRYPVTAILAEARIIAGLAWPVMLTSLNWTLMHLIDVAVVGRYSTAELGYLAAGRSITFISIVMAFTGMSGVLVFASRADGARDWRATGEYARAGLLFGLLLGLFLMIVLVAGAEPFLRWAGIPPAMLAGGVAVTRAMALAYPWQLAMAGLSYFLEGVSRPRRVMAVNVAMLPLNAVLAWAWVGGHLGLPAMGAVGAVLATAVVSAFGMLAMLAQVWTLPDAAVRNIRDLSIAAWARAAAGLPALVRFGTVPAIAGALELAGFSYLIILSTQLGIATAAAFQTIFSIHNFTFALAMGFASAAGVRVGNAVGAGEHEQAVPRTLVAVGLATISVGLLSVAMFAGRHALVAPFSDDAEVLRLSAAMLAIIAPFMLFDSVQVIYVYAMRSLGDQAAAGVNGIIAFFGVTGGSGWYLVRQGWGTDGLAIAFAAGLVVAAILQAARMHLVSSRLRH